MQVISSDANARFVTLGINKSVVIDLPVDVRDVLIGNPNIVLAVVRSKRRVYITAGPKAGQTNVYFFNPAGQQIGGLDIAVTDDPSASPVPTGPLQNFGVPAKLIEVVSGVDKDGNARFQLLKCAPKCTVTKFPPPELPVQRFENNNNNINNNFNH